MTPRIRILLTAVALTLTAGAAGAWCSGPGCTLTTDPYARYGNNAYGLAILDHACPAGYAPSTLNNRRVCTRVPGLAHKHIYAYWCPVHGYSHHPHHH